MTPQIPTDLESQKELISSHPWMINNMWAPDAELQRMVLKLDGSYLGSIKGGLKAEVLEDPVIKDNIIRHLLWLIKKNQLDRLRSRLEDLNWVRVNWPEIRIIRDSLDHMKAIRESTGFDKITLDDVLRVMTNGVGDNLRLATRVVSEFDDITKTALRSAMEHSKSSIMANLLELYFMGDMASVIHMSRLLSATQIKWPEFSNLPKSLEKVLYSEFERRAESGGAAAAVNCLDALRASGVDVSGMEKRFKRDLLPTMIKDFAQPLTPCYLLADDILALHELGADPAAMRKVLEAKQTFLIRTLLVAVLNKHYLDTNRLIAGLREFGIAWSELDVIEQSLESGSLEESVSSDEELRGLVDHLITELRKGNTTLVLRGILHKFEDRYDLSIEQMDALLAPAMDDIFSKLSKDLSGRGISIGLKDLDMMSRFGLDIKPLIGLIEDNKTTILRFLLTQIREKQSTAISMKFVEMLERMGTDWPEFDAIRSASEAEWIEIRRNRESW